MVPPLARVLAARKADEEGSAKEEDVIDLVQAQRECPEVLAGNSPLVGKGSSARGVDVKPHGSGGAVKESCGKEDGAFRRRGRRVVFQRRSGAHEIGRAGEAASGDCNVCS